MCFAVKKCRRKCCKPNDIFIIIVIQLSQYNIQTINFIVFRFKKFYVEIFISIKYKYVQRFWTCKKWIAINLIHIAKDDRETRNYNYKIFIDFAMPIQYNMPASTCNVP